MFNTYHQLCLTAESEIKFFFPNLHNKSQGYETKISIFYVAVACCVY